MTYSLTKKNYKIHALHGFLGLPNDWKKINFPNEFQQNFFAPDLLNDFPINSFLEWAKLFNKHVLNNQKFSEENILMGYSLGGRLGLHVLLDRPKIWKAAIFISTHPGIKSLEERKMRILSDEILAKRFENESWDPLMQSWNSREIFKSYSFCFERNELDYDREKLSRALKIWSLGNQKNLTFELNMLEIPILWMVGMEDLKFLSLTQELNFKNPASKICIVEDSAHRLPWQKPENFLLNVTKFIQTLESQHR